MTACQASDPQVDGVAAGKKPKTEDAQKQRPDDSDRQTTPGVESPDNLSDGQKPSTVIEPGASEIPPQNAGGSTAGGDDLSGLLSNLGDLLNGGGGGTAQGNDPGAANGSTTTPPPVTPAAVSGDCYKGDPFICDVERAIVAQTNTKRGSASPLALDAKLAFVARDWSRQQGQRGSIGHQGFPGQRGAVYQGEFGASTSMTAENVAMSSMNSNASAEDVATTFVEMWWRSPGHHQNMVGNHRRLGAGVYRSGGSVYATQIFGN